MVSWETFGMVLVVGVAVMMLLTSGFVGLLLIGSYLSHRSRQGILNRDWWHDLVEQMTEGEREMALHRLVIHSSPDGDVNLRLMVPSELRRREPKPEVPDA